MPKIAAMGDKDSIYGFASLGLDIFPEDDATSASHTLRRLAESGYAVIYLTEKLASRLTPELEHYREQTTPAIIPIPGVTGNTGLGMANVTKSVEQAVGSDILSD